ncbi:MAG: hypothetical protein ACRCXK_14385 [Wohlfahrtiimonas sp.]
MKLSNNNLSLLIKIIIISYLAVLAFFSGSLEAFINLVIFSGIVSFILAIVYLVFVRHQRIYSTFENLPESKIAHMPIGMVELKGRFLVVQPVDIPYVYKSGMGYRYQYFKGYWKSDGTKEYKLFEEHENFSDVFFQDETGKIAIDTSVLWMVDEQVCEKISVGNDLVEITFLHDERIEYSLVGYYQTDIDIGAKIVGDKKNNKILCIPADKSAELHRNSIHRKLFQGAKYFIIGTLFLIGFILYLTSSQQNSTVHSIHAILFFSYLIGNVLILLVGIILGKTKKSNLFFNTISVSFFPNILLLLFGMAIGINIQGLVLSAIAILVIVSFFCIKYERELIEAFYTDKEAKIQ